MLRVNVLIAEDEKRLRDFLSETLRTDGYAVYPCSDYEELECFLGHPSFAPDLLVLDRLLRDRDALMLVPSLRKAFPASKLLILSAVNVATEKARALDLGADDYLAKPFSSVELLARLRALGRRAGEAPSRLCLGNLYLDGALRVAIVAGGRLHLSNKEYQVLLTLLQRPGKVFSKTELMERVWDLNGFTESNVVETTISNLRRKLQERASTAVIRNMRNVGYWIET